MPGMAWISFNTEATRARFSGCELFGEDGTAIDKPRHQIPFRLDESDNFRSDTQLSGNRLCATSYSRLIPSRSVLSPETPEYMDSLPHLHDNSGLSSRPAAERP